MIDDVSRKEMITYPQIDPTLLKLGPVEIKWYGFMYVVGFILAYFVIKSESKRKHLGYSEDDIHDFVFYLVIGVILGGRVGYILFYNLAFYIANPLDILKIYQGGMSFHGGFLGVIIAGLIFCKKKKKRFYELADMGALAGCLGLGFGRIGNFINAELYGRVVDPSFPLAMVFPGGGDLPRHPSQLYESFFEGFIMFAILFFFSRKNLKPGIIFWMFIMLYGIFRFFIEFTREPDAQLGFILANYFSMGQLLCFPMILSGLIMIIIISKRRVGNIQLDKDIIVEN